MLEEISWSQFFTAVGIAVVSYYAITVLLLFSTEIKSFLNRKQHASDDYQNKDHSVHHDVLGITREVIRPKSNADGYPPRDPKDDAEQDEELLTGAVADLLDEIKNRLITLDGWQKDECLPALKEVIQKYPQLLGTVYQESINHFIANTCSDHFSWSVEPEEIATLWPDHS